MAARDDAASRLRAEINDEFTSRQRREASSGAPLLRRGPSRHRLGLSTGGACKCEMCLKPPCAGSDMLPPQPRARPPARPAPQHAEEASVTSSRPPPKARPRPSLVRVSNLADGSTRTFTAWSNGSMSDAGAAGVAGDSSSHDGGDLRIIESARQPGLFEVSCGGQRQLSPLPLTIGSCRVDLVSSSAAAAATLLITGDGGAADLHVEAWSVSVHLSRCRDFGSVTLKLSGVAGINIDGLSASVLVVTGSSAAAARISNVHVDAIGGIGIETPHDVVFDGDTSCASLRVTSSLTSFLGRVDVMGNANLNTHLAVQRPRDFCDLRIGAGGRLAAGGCLLGTHGGVSVEGTLQTTDWALALTNIAIGTGGRVFCEAQTLCLSGASCRLARGGVLGCQTGHLHLDFEACHLHGQLTGGPTGSLPLNTLTVVASHIEHSEATLATRDHLHVILRPPSAHGGGTDGAGPILLAAINTPGAAAVSCPCGDLRLAQNITAGKLELTALGALEIGAAALLTAADDLSLAARTLEICGRVQSAAGFRLTCQQVVMPSGSLLLPNLLAVCSCTQLVVDLGSQAVLVPKDVILPACTLTTNGDFSVIDLANVTVRGNLVVRAANIDAGAARLYVAGSLHFSAEDGRVHLGTARLEQRIFVDDWMGHSEVPYTYYEPSGSFTVAKDVIDLRATIVHIDTTEIWAGAGLAVNAASFVSTASVLTSVGDATLNCRSIETTPHPLAKVHVPKKYYTYTQRWYTVETSRANIWRFHRRLSLGGCEAWTNTSSVVNVAGGHVTVDSAPVLQVGVLQNTNLMLDHQGRYHKEGQVRRHDSQFPYNTAVVAAFNLGQDMQLQLSSELINDGVIEADGQLAVVSVGDVVSRMIALPDGTNLQVTPLREVLHKSALFHCVQHVMTPVVPLEGCQSWAVPTLVVVGEDASLLRHAKPVLNPAAMAYSLNLVRPNIRDLEAACVSFQQNAIEFLEQQQVHATRVGDVHLLSPQLVHCLLDPTKLPLGRPLLFWTLQQTDSSESLLAPILAVRANPTKAGVVKAKRLTVRAQNIHGCGGDFEATDGDVELEARRDVRLEASLHHTRRQLDHNTFEHRRINTPSSVHAAAGHVKITAGDHVTVKGSSIAAEAEATIQAGGDIHLQAVQNEVHIESVKTKRCSLGKRSKHVSGTVTTNTVPAKVQGSCVRLEAAGSIIGEAPHIHAGRGGVFIRAGGAVIIGPAVEQRLRYSLRTSSDLVWTEAEFTRSEHLLMVDGECIVSPDASVHIDAQQVILRTSRRADTALDPLLNALAQQPGSQVSIIDDQLHFFHEKHCGLSAPAKLLLTAAVSGGLGGPLLGMAAKLTTGLGLCGTSAAIATTAFHIGMKTLSAHVAVGVLSHRGDLGKALKSLSSSDTLKDIAQSMATAGLFGSLCAGLDMPVGNPAAQGFTKSAFGDVLKRTLAKTAASLTAAGVVHGRIPDILQSVRGAAGDQLGEFLHGNVSSLPDNLSTVFCHTAIGAACGLLSDDNNALAGAIGGLVGSLTADLGVSGLSSPDGDTASPVRAGKWLSKGLAATIAMALKQDVAAASNAAEVSFTNTQDTRRELLRSLQVTRRTLNDTNLAVQHAYVIRRPLTFKSLSAPKLGVISHSGLLLALKDNTYAIVEFGLHRQDQVTVTPLMRHEALLNGSGSFVSPDGHVWTKQRKGKSVECDCTLADVQRVMASQPGKPGYRAIGPEPRNCHTAQEHVRRTLFRHDVK